MGVLAAFTAALTVTFWPGGPSESPVSYRVVCPGNAACARLARAASQAFAPLPKDMMCTQIYGGPQQALVTGRLNERKVWVRFKRTDGCQIERWNRLAFLFHA
jgi:hypothetical protein